MNDAKGDSSWADFLVGSVGQTTGCALPRLPRGGETWPYLDEETDLHMFPIYMAVPGCLRKNIARGTTDPGIDLVTWTGIGSNMAPPALIAGWATKSLGRWHSLHWSPGCKTCIAYYLMDGRVELINAIKSSVTHFYTP